MTNRNRKRKVAFLRTEIEASLKNVDFLTPVKKLSKLLKNMFLQPVTGTSRSIGRDSEEKTLLTGIQNVLRCFGWCLRAVNKTFIKFKCRALKLLFSSLLSSFNVNCNSTVAMVYSPLRLRIYRWCNNGPEKVVD